MEDAAKLNFIKHFTGLRSEDQFDGSNQPDIRTWLEDQRKIYDTWRGAEHDEPAWRIAIPLMLSGDALRWYRHSLTDAERGRAWDGANGVKSLFMAEYVHERTIVQLNGDLSTISQREGEKVSAYFSRFMALHKECVQHTTFQLSTSQYTSFFDGGLRADIQREVLRERKAKDPEEGANSLKNAKTQAVDFERMISNMAEMKVPSDTVNAMSMPQSATKSSPAPNVMNLAPGKLVFGGNQSSTPKRRTPFCTVKGCNAPDGDHHTRDCPLQDEFLKWVESNSSNSVSCGTSELSTYTIELTIGGVSCEGIVDTGSSCCLLDPVFAMKFKNYTSDVNTWLSTVNGMKRVDQVVECVTEVGGNSFDQKFLVSTNPFGILLGQDFVKQMGGPISTFEVIKNQKINFINQVYFSTNKGFMLNSTLDRSVSVGVVEEEVHCLVEEEVRCLVDEEVQCLVEGEVQCLVGEEIQCLVEEEVQCMDEREMSSELGEEICNGRVDSVVRRRGRRKGASQTSEVISVVGECGSSTSSGALKRCGKRRRGRGRRRKVIMEEDVLSMEEGIVDEDVILVQDYSCFEPFYGGCAKVPPVIINTGSSAPVSSSTPIFTPHDEEMFRDFVEEGLESGLIERCSFSQWSSKLKLVPKFSDLGEFVKWRPTLNLIPLNRLCEKDSYHPPHIGSLQFKLSGAKFFSIVDLTSAHNQLPLDDTSKAKTAFLTPFGMFNFCCMPQGWVNSNSAFQRVIDAVLRDVGGFSFPFQDDVLIWVRQKRSAWGRTREVLERLSEFNLKCNHSKCSFVEEEVRFMGFLINGNGIRNLDERTKAISEMVPPESVTEVRSFLGMINHLRTFLGPHLSEIAGPLYDLATSEGEFLRTSVYDSAFQLLKKAILILSELNIEYENNVVGSSVSKYRYELDGRVLGDNLMIDSSLKSQAKQVKPLFPIPLHAIVQDLELSLRIPTILSTAALVCVFLGSPLFTPKGRHTKQNCPLLVVKAVFSLESSFEFPPRQGYYLEKKATIREKK